MLRGKPGKGIGRWTYNPLLGRQKSLTVKDIFNMAISGFPVPFRFP
jgi:hypothetical protein